MPVAGNSFISTLKQAHLKWGTHRHTTTRGRRKGEAYIQIPRYIARTLGIYTKFHPNANAIYKCSSVDGFLNNKFLLASGSSGSHDTYAKQFSGMGDLKLLGRWFRYINAQPGDKIEVTFNSSNDITVRKI